MGYDKPTVECDGDHPGFGSSTEISDGEEVYCQGCVETLNERIKELEGELESAKDELGAEQDIVQDLKQQLADAQN